MSSDLVKRLRDENGGWVSDHALEAAARIEALEGENAALKEQFDNLNNDYGIELSRYAHAKAAAEVAEARAERLRVVLEPLIGLATDLCGKHAHKSQVLTNARKALEDDKQ